MENKEAIYELKKDICTPNGYVRAGLRNTRAGWEKDWPNAFDFHSNEWFIEIKADTPIETDTDMEYEIVRDIFEKRGLHSISYKEAAVACIKEYKLRTTKQPNNA